MPATEQDQTARGPARPDLLRHESLPDLLEASVRRDPARVAARFGAAALTYGELDRRADLVAHALIGAGARPDAVIGLWLPRGLDLLVGQAGIAKSGAAWLPFDADAPPERIAACLADAGAIGLLTDAAGAARLPRSAVPCWDFAGLGEVPAGALRRREGLEPAHAAYVIYTSGSTGRPKGIVVEHRSICHLLRAENDVLGVRAEDVVYQGFSIAFDMSFEEIWISWLAGASLWVAPPELVGDAEALPRALAEAGVTVVHAVPTLLALIPEPIPGVRLINLGGEACPQALADRLAGRAARVFNTYGPTEATVTASIAELMPGRAVTIGRPLPNYGMLVVDERLRAVPRGLVGELCICGPGVARGYLGRPELTAERFVANPFTTGADDAVLYRTGDLGRIAESGEIVCLGRSDDQVKIRGFRVELGEIEAALAAIPGVGAAAVAVRQEGGAEHLVAFVVALAGARLDRVMMRTALLAALPPYMVPTRIGAVAELPRLASGKVDRQRLAELPLPAEPEAPVAADEPRDEAEADLAREIAQLFPGRAFRRDDDFFADLGGHSLLAARLASALRARPRWKHLALRDIYRRRTLGGIAEAMLASPLPGTGYSAPAPTPVVSSHRPGARRWLCGMAQVAVWPVLVSIHVGRWLAPFFAYHNLTGDEDDSIIVAVSTALATFIAMHLLGFLIAIVGTRLASIGLRAGRYPLWGFAYFRWWFTERVREVAPEHLLHGSPLYALYLRGLGARVGREAAIGSVEVRAPWLLRIGEGASVGSAVTLQNAHATPDELRLAPIAIGRDAYVGSYAVIAGDVVVEDRGRLDGLSALVAGASVPAGESWEGVPAQPSDRPRPSLPPRPRSSVVGRLAEAGAHALGAVAVAVLFFLPIFPTFMLIDRIDDLVLSSVEEHGRILTALEYALLALPASAVLVALTVLICAAIRWSALPRLAAGIYPARGWLAYRRWLSNQIQEASLENLHGIYASVFAPWWYRLLGASVGRGSEVSTAMGVVPEMLSLGEDSFIADGVMLGDEEVEGGWMTLRPTTVGRNSFIGNAAYVPDGSVVPDGVLIGVQSRVPANADMRPGDTWVGSPPTRLPAREQAVGFDAALTFQPSLARRLARGAIETLRIVVPISVTIGFSYAIIFDVLPYAEEEAWGLVVLHLALYGMLYGLSCFGLVAVLKWMFVGVYRPAAYPMWSLPVWVSEAVTNLYESLTVPNCLEMLRGTPLLPWALRLLGARIGSGCWLDTTDLTEFDCVVIGDHCALNADCGPQTHLFEDRIMKIGRVAIGDEAVLHARATVLYDAEVGDGCELGPLTLVMKGERLPPRSRWCGSPAEPWQD